MAIAVGPTQQQLEILALYAAGHNFHRIGELIFLSEHTVKYHLTELRRAVGAGSNTHALVLCIARGYLCVDGRSDEVFVPELVAA